MRTPSSISPDRRRRRRYTIGVQVRVQLDAHSESLAADLVDVSATGCFLRGAEVSFLATAGDRLAFGFVLASDEIALVRGRVVRRVPGEGLGILINQANQNYDALVGQLASTYALVGHAS